MSGLRAYHHATQITSEQFERLDGLAYRLENGLLKLVEALERKAQDGDWTDTLIVKETNAVYNAASLITP